VNTRLRFAAIAVAAAVPLSLSIGAAAAGNGNGKAPAAISSASGTAVTTSAAPTTTPPPSYEHTGDEGCTPGYWKNHTDSREGYSTGTTLGSVFSGTGQYSGTTLIEALSFRGGNGADGAVRILFRAATAALLNAANDGVDYALLTDEIVTQLNSALAGADRAAILDLATELDDANNGGCTLNGSAGAPAPPRTTRAPPHGSAGALLHRHPTRSAHSPASGT